MSEDIHLSDRERAEGFLAFVSGLLVDFPGERAEGFRAVLSEIVVLIHRDRAENFLSG